VVGQYEPIRQLEATAPVQYMPLEQGVTIPDPPSHVLPAGHVDEGEMAPFPQNLLGGQGDVGDDN
jgi:hypothetical protein